MIVKFWSGLRGRDWKSNAIFRPYFWPLSQLGISAEKYSSGVILGVLLTYDNAVTATFGLSAKIWIRRFRPIFGPFSQSKKNAEKFVSGVILGVLSAYDSEILVRAKGRGRKSIFWVSASFLAVCTTLKKRGKVLFWGNFRRTFNLW